MAGQLADAGDRGAGAVRQPPTRLASGDGHISLNEADHEVGRRLLSDRADSGDDCDGCPSRVAGIPAGIPGIPMDVLTSWVAWEDVVFPASAPRRRVWHRRVMMWQPPFGCWRRPAGP